MLAPGRKGAADLSAGLIVISLGAVWTWYAGDYGYIGEGGRMAAGTLPAIAGGVLIACGLAVVITALGRVVTGPADGDGSHGQRPKGPRRPPSGALDSGSRRLLLLGGLAICLLAAPLLGFTASFAVLTFLVMKLLERRSVVAATLSALAIFAFGYVVFELLLQVPLP